MSWSRGRGRWWRTGRMLGTTGGSSARVGRRGEYNWRDGGRARLTWRCYPCAAAMPAARPVAQAQRKLYPPIGPNASSTSPDRVEPGVPPALQRPRVHLRQAHPAARHLRLLVALVSGPRQLAAHQHLDQPAALLPAELRQRSGRSDTGRLGQRVGEPLGQLAPEHPGDRTGPLRPERGLPRRLVETGPLHREPGAGVTLQARAHQDVGDVEHRRAAVPAVGEEEPTAAAGAPSGHRAR